MFLELDLSCANIKATSDKIGSLDLEVIHCPGILFESDRFFSPLSLIII